MVFAFSMFSRLVSSDRFAVFESLMLVLEISLTRQVALTFVLTLVSAMLLMSIAAIDASEVVIGLLSSC